MLATALFVASFAQAAVVKPTAWSASSAATASEGISYDAQNLGDSKQGVFWANADKQSGLGQWVMADFGGEKTIGSLTVWPGCWYTLDYWKRYSRPKTLVAEFSDGTSQEFTLEDAYKPQTLKLTAPKNTSTVKLKIKGAYDGSTWSEAAISEVVFRDAGKESRTRAGSFAASTTYPADADGNYDAANTQDGIIDSIWCEGNKNGDGTGDWVEFTYNTPMSVSQLILRQGNATSFSLFMKSNRATAATLTFADGSKESLTLKDTLSEQTLTFPSHTTDKVRLSFDTVKKGSEFNDMCVSEAWLAP